MCILINPKPFDEYIKSLSSHARKDWVYVQKHNQDLKYESIPYDNRLNTAFMQLWEQQFIRGERKQWAFPESYVAELARKGELRFFIAIRDSNPIAAHFIQKRIGYWECHPPMYDKKDNKRYLGKFMWFNLFKFASENDLGILDMGSGPDSWREMIRDRDKYPNPKYKWIYVPEEVKNNPDKEPNYYIENHALIRKTD
jgi:hypothetical protein